MHTQQAAQSPQVSQPSRSSDNRILRLPRVMELTGLGRSSILASVKAGTFPMSISLGARSVGYVESEVNDWIADRIAKRDAKRVLQ